jgi:hypothetical protein
MNFYIQKLKIQLIQKKITQKLDFIETWVKNFYLFYI